MINKMEEQVIYPRDLLFAALFRWKAAVALGLVLAVLLGGFIIIRSSGTGTDSDAQAAYQEALADYAAEKAALDNYVQWCKNEVRVQEEYMANSLYLSLNPYSHYRGIVRFYISNDYQIQPDKTYQTPNTINYILASYHALLQSDGTIAALAQTAGMEWRLFYEIYSVYYDAAINTLTVHISHNDQAMTEKLLGQVLRILEQGKEKMVQSIGEHTVSVLSKDVNIVVDTAVNTAVKENQDHLRYLQEELVRAQSAADALMPPVQPASGVSVKKAVVFAVLGFVAGVALVAVYSWFVHMETDKLYSARLLQMRTGVKVLGTLNVTEFGYVDRLIRKWEGRDCVDGKQKAVLLAKDIQNRVSTGRVLLTGTGSSEGRAVLAQALNEAGVQVVDDGCLLENPEAMTALSTVDTVVLAEQCAKANCTDIFNEIQIINDYGKTLIGCVVLDG